jgi:aminopeptidase-like protein
LSRGLTLQERVKEERAEDVSGAMMSLIRDLFPICRSITGDGLRRSLDIIKSQIGIEIHEVPTGAPALDWTVPREWNVREAWIATLDGRRVVDFARSNLHLVQYSTPIDQVVSLPELRSHLHTLPQTPEWIPYRTAYYADTWGFCLTHRQYEAMTDPWYRVRIDSMLEPGALSYGELVLPGASAEEFLFSCHICHPSLANDNLSGITVAVALARWLAARNNRLTYRFLFIPGTIGSLVWLARNDDAVARTTHGLVLTCLGDEGSFTYKASRRGDALIDRIAAHVLRHCGSPHRLQRFVPYGYDERQYCSPGFDMPVGCLMRSPWGQYPEYHTSADNLDILSPERLAASLQLLTEIAATADGNLLYRSRCPRGEPQLGRRGLYRAIGGEKEAGGFDQMALLWVLNLADGKHTLLDMAERAEQPFATLRAAADALVGADLLELVG